MPTPDFNPPPAHDAPLPPPLETSRGTRLLTGVPYAALPGIRPLEIDVWLPLRSEDPAPAVLFLHGGGWRAGSRHLAGPAFRGVLPSPFEQVARAGIAVASADYRLSGEATWPAQLHDVKAAVRWLRARAGELGIDGDRIAAWGESAGGHLAELLGLTTGDPALEGDVGVTGPSSEVCAVVAWYAPSDLRMMAADTGHQPDGPETPARPGCWARRRPSSPTPPRRPARSRTSPPEPRRSCCCTARPIASSRACRVNGCTAHCGRRA